MVKYSNPIYFKYSDELKKALLQDDIKFLKVYGDDDICVEYKRVIEEKPFTNADHIRAMTDKELAEWFLKIAVCPCDAMNDGCALNDDTCRQAWLDWLKEEVKE